jgi:hypothetical protein
LDGRLASADRFWDLRLQSVVRDTHTLAAPTLVIGIPCKLVAGRREPLCLTGLFFTL